MTSIYSKLNELAGICDSRCSHGGICVLKAGYEGKHDSRYCQWTDATALDADKSDEIFHEKLAKVLTGAKE